LVEKMRGARDKARELYISRARNTKRSRADCDAMFALFNVE
jgi:hypothetical protein